MQFSELDIPCEQFTLENGLTVIVHEDHKTPIVSVNVWYHVGSKNEKSGKTGFAHLFEHLMFGGTEHLPGSYIDTMERIGATDLNGTTNEDRTNYFENVPSSGLDFALFAESDRMGYFYETISQDILDVQRGVVQNEKRQSENQPYAVVEELVVKSTYPSGHPYAHTVIGSMEDLTNASLDDVREWFRTYYTPSNAVLVIAGDVSSKDAREKAEQYFGEIAAGPPLARQLTWIAKMKGEHRESVEDRVPQARIYKLWNVPGYGAQDSSYLRLVAGILSSGKNSRLYKRLVYDEQIATQISAYLDEHEIGSQFLLTATAREAQDLNKVERAVDEELARFLDEGPTEREVQRIKTQTYAAFVRGVERIGSFGGKSDVLATNQTYLGSANAYRRRLGHYADASAASLRNAARSWLSDGVYALEVHPFRPAKQAAIPSDRSHVPALAPRHQLNLPRFEEDVLNNGARVLLAERHDVPLVNVWLDLDAGYAADHFAGSGAARLASSLLTSGSTRHNALEISEEVQLLGAQLGAGCNLDLCSVYLSALTSVLDKGLELFAEIVLDPIFPDTDFDRQRTLQLSTIANEKATPLQMLFRALPPLLFGREHLYGVPLTGTGTEESLRSMTRENVAAFHSTWFRPGDATFIVVGDTTLAKIKLKLESLFANWPNQAVPLKEITGVPRPAKPVVYLIDRPGSLHSVVMAATLAPPPDPQNEIALQAMNNIFGGTFGARLNMNLREEKHWSYGAASVLYPARGQRPFLSYASVQADKTVETIEEMLSEFVGMTGRRPATAEELEKVKHQQILELPGAFETMSAIGNLCSDLLQQRLPLDFYDTYVSRILALTTADIESCAKSLLDPQRMIWLVVGNAAELEPGLAKLGIGEIVPTEA